MPQTKKMWGTSIWTFFHTIAASLDDTNFNKTLASELFSYILQICNLLPCPSCSKSATNYLNNVHFDDLINSKQELCILLYQFHDFVNIKTNSPIFLESVQNLSIYNNTNVKDAYNNFLTSFTPKKYIIVPQNTRHSAIKLLLESLDAWMKEKFSDSFTPV